MKALKDILIMVLKLYIRLISMPNDQTRTGSPKEPLLPWQNRLVPVLVTTRA